jgi:hypothetical protein
MFHETVFDDKRHFKVWGDDAGENKCFQNAHMVADDHERWCAGTQVIQSTQMEPSAAFLDQFKNPVG